MNECNDIICRRRRHSSSGLPVTAIGIAAIIWLSSCLIVVGAFSLVTLSSGRLEIFSSRSRAFFQGVPRHHFSINTYSSDGQEEKKNSTDSNNTEDGIIEIKDNDEGKKFQFLKRVKSTAVEGLGVTTTPLKKLSKIAETGRSGVRSVASSATVGLAEITDKGSSSVRNAAGSAASSLKYLAKKGAEDVVSTTSRAKEVAVGSARGAGEVAKWMDSQARGGVDSVNAKAQSLVLGFTGKQDYQPGDVTRELLRKITSTEYDINDILLLLKIMLAVGASIGPLAKVLPVTVLLEMLNVSMERQIGGKLLDTLASSLDGRFSAAFFSNDDKFQLGDAVRRSAMSAVTDFTGKDSYKSGDIERAVSESKNQDNTDGPVTAPVTKVKTLNLLVDPEFDEWDKKFLDSQEINMEDMTEESGLNPKVLDMEIAMGLFTEETTYSSKTETVPSSVEVAKFCIFCGTKLPKVAKYCSSCGGLQLEEE